jgi:alkylhydroperoxidase family enzyme
MARIPYLDLDQAPAETRAAWDHVGRVRGRLRPQHLYRLLAHNPAIMLAWSALAQTLRGLDAEGAPADTTMALAGRCRELAILEVCRVTGCAYEWELHARSGARTGIGAAELDALRQGDRSPFSEAERALLAHAGALASLHATEATAGALRVHYSDREILELTVIVGFYSGVARVVSGLAVDPEPDLGAP